MVTDAAALVGAAALLAVHATSCATAVWRQYPRKRCSPHEKVSLIRPLRGYDPFTTLCLASTFRLDHGATELIFCVASPADAVIPIVRSLIEQHPHIDARLLIGDERISENPKLNNLVKGYEAARHDWIAFVDANVLLPSDAIARLLSSFANDTGFVSSPPVGSHPDGWAALTECAILNSYQARWQTFADTFGHGFAQGKVLMFSRRWLEQAGGLKCLAAEPAEDAAATKVTRRAGRQVKLVGQFFPQPVGSRRLRDIWDRQARWANLRRASFPMHYALEALSFPWLAVALTASTVEGALIQLIVSTGVLFIWYALEWLCSWFLGWPEQFKHRVIRDLILPAAWLRGWLRSNFEWHGHAMTAARDQRPRRAL